MFPPVLLLAVVAVATVPAAAALASARWPSRSPAAAILLWQALGLSWGLAAVGALAGLGAVHARGGVAGGALIALAGILTWFGLPVWARRAGIGAAPDADEEDAPEG